MESALPFPKFQSYIINNFFLKKSTVCHHRIIQVYPLKLSQCISTSLLFISFKPNTFDEGLMPIHSFSGEMSLFLQGEASFGFQLDFLLFMFFVKFLPFTYGIITYTIFSSSTTITQFFNFL